MRLLTKTFLIEGLNQKILLERLSLSGVDLLKVKKIDQKRMEITIDSKDGLIFFAICKKTWYNKLMRVGGILSPFYHMVKSPIKIVCLIISLSLIIFSENIFFESVYQGDALLFRSKIDSAFEGAGISKYSLFDSRKLERAKAILQEQNSFGYLSIQKQGNRAVIQLHALEEAPQKLVSQTSDLVASENMRILRATVYSGTLLKEEGESVSKGEVIVGAYYFIDDKKISCELCARITAECVYEYRYKSNYGVNSDLILNAIAAAKLMLGDYEVLSVEHKIDKDDVIVVTLRYEKVICGG